MARKASYLSNQLQTRHWNGYGSNRVATVSLPPKLRCSVCNKHKNTEPNFSGKQLAGLKEVVARQGQDAAQAHEVVCIPCSTAAISYEMTCIDCDQTMGLDAFAKTQRKDRDNAKCKRCSAKRVGLKPIEDLGDKDKNNTSSRVEITDFFEEDCWSEFGSSMDDSSSVTGSLSSMTLGSLASHSTRSISSLASSMNTSSNFEGGVRILSADSVLDDDAYRKRSKRTDSMAGSMLGSTASSAHSTGITSRAANASSSAFSTPGYTQQSTRPIALAPPRPAPSVADSTTSTASSDTETGSRAKFSRFPRAQRASESTTGEDDADDSESEDEWDTDDRHAANEDDSDDNSDGPDFFG